MCDTKKLTEWVAQKGGVISVREVKGRIAKRAEDEVEKARDALRKAEIAVKGKEKRGLMLEKRPKSFVQKLKAYLMARTQLGRG